MAHRQPSGGGTTISDSFGIVDDFSEEEHDLFVRRGKMNMGHGMEHESQNKPVYLLEHLATFTVNKDAGIEFPADGMRRLLQLEKTTGIWSQKMQLCLDNQWVLIIDFETGNVIERFPATLVKEPTAFTSLDSMELYNNILVFIVSNGNNSRSEMHIFQSQSISAVDLVEDLKALRAGKSINQKRNFSKQMNSGKIGEEAINADAIMERSSFRSQNAVNNNKINILPKFSPTEEYGYNRGDVATRGTAGDTDSEHGINEETCSISSDKYERDVAVLNHCFDDIEKFIARLQHAAAASRELERRRKNRKSKKKDPGEGLLTLRTRPPHEKEFTDIFAKFKLSFNLLAKLKAHIHDPNAPELVHFLFTPLALIVEAASDTYFESQIPSRVVNPLLTREAINLLINCVTSKETELWRSLGETWTIPRDQWKEDIGSYHPVFLDGWSPEYIVVDENEVSKTSNKLNTNDKSLRRTLNFDNSGKYQSHDKEEIIGSGNDFSNRSELSFDSIDRNLYSSNNLMIDNDTVEIPSASGQIHVQSLNSELQNMHIRDEKLQSTHTVANKMSHSEFANRSHTVDSWLDELQLNGAKVVQVTYPRTANNDKELTVIRGEYLEILDDSRKWWKARNINGIIGHVPHTIVTSQFYGSESSNNQVQNHENKKRQSNSLVMNEPNSEKTDVKNKYIGKKGEFRYI